MTHHQRALGLDLGTKTIGLAFSDALRGVASAGVTLQRSKFTEDAARLMALIAARSVVGVVLGLPLNMGRDRRPRASST
ncbi:MAG: Holliday junction resolvase RuvX, partial [Candidatus Competibacteraceae bacterium]|nr:Holliday junction resolvase RuvX [Candidatus Competibacteraceae bacterium]